MDHDPHQSQTSTARRSLKRKLQQQFTEEADQVEADRKILIREPQELQQDLASRVLAQVKFLNSSFPSSKSDRAAAKRAVCVLCELAKNEDNVDAIVEYGAIPALVRHLKSPEPVREDYGATKPSEHELERACIFTLGLLAVKVGVIGNLVHSSPNIKKEVLLAGALQPVIGLLSSCCSKSQREAALLLGQFAATDSDCKVHIAQRGALQPLIDMLRSPDPQLTKMVAFALGRLAQDAHNQAGIAHNGGIEPLLNLLGSKNGTLQHNAAFALFGLADNEENVAEIIKVGGV